MKRDELIQQMHDLQQGKIPYDEVYHTIHEFGRENFRKARPVVESFSPMKTSNGAILLWKCSPTIGVWLSIGKQQETFWSMILMRIAEEEELPRLHYSK